MIYLTLVLLLTFAQGEAKYMPLIYDFKPDIIDYIDRDIEPAEGFYMVILATS